MTLEEAEKIAEICSHCDMICPNCVAGLCELLQDGFPEFVWTYLCENGDREYRCRLTVKKHDNKKEPAESHSLSAHSAAQVLP